MSYARAQAASNRIARQLEAETDRRVNNAIQGLQIPIMQLNPIFRFAATLSTTEASAAVARIRAYAIAQGAIVVH